MGELLLITIFLFYFLSSIIFWIYLFNRRDRIKKIGFSIFGIGYLLQLVYIGYMDLKMKTFFVNSFNDLPAFIAFVIGSIFYVLILFYREKVKDLSPLVSTINTILLAFSIAFLENESITKFNNLWFSLHIISAVISFSLIVFSIITGILYLLLQRNLKNKNFNSFFIEKMNLSLDTIYKIINKLNISILISLTIMSITSLIWQKHIAKRDFLFSVEDISLIFLIIYYGVLVHIRTDRRNIQIFATLLGNILAIVVFIYWLLGHKN
jgi:ABC-type uncharacterized transport system permease subunit